MRLALVSLFAFAAAAPALAQPAAPAPAPAAAPPAPDAASRAIIDKFLAQPAPSTSTTPPPPPAPPTDPAAISVLSTLQKVCIPAANGGDLSSLAKAGGYRKSGDVWMLRQRDFTLTIEPSGTNPNQCHVDVAHAVDQQAPGRPIVIALSDWATLENGWNLYRNDKNVHDGAEWTTRSWQHAAGGKFENLVFSTQRHPDGSPLQRGADTSELIYSVSR